MRSKQISDSPKTFVMITDTSDEILNQTSRSRLESTKERNLWDSRS